MTSMHTAEPALRILPAATPETRAVVLVLHGGRAVDTAAVRPTQLAYLRMLPFMRTVHDAVDRAGAAVWLLRNRVRGWNEPALDPVHDARWALAEVQRSHPRAGIVLLGHSMGARAALRVAGSDTVRAVCALAPWVERDDPVAQLAGRRVLIAHGTRDRVTPASTSAAYARKARIAGIKIERTTLRGSGHAMLCRHGQWTRYVRRFVGGAVNDIVDGRDGRTG